MPTNAHFDMFDTDYVDNLEGCRLLANSLVAELNSLSTPSVSAFVDSLTTRQELDQYILDNPISTNSMQPGDIDITLFNTDDLGINSLVYAENGKIVARKLQLSEIVCSNTLPVDGYIATTNYIGSKESSVPSATTALPNSNLVCIKNGKVIAFPSDPDPDIKELFLGVNNIAVGVSAYFGNPDMIPAGWLLEDGREVLKSQYPKLYSVIGDKYGASSSPDKFKIPDKRGLFIIGHDPADVLRVSRYPGGVSGASVGSMSNYFSGNTVPTHSHNSASTALVVDFSKVPTVYRFIAGLVTAYGYVYDASIGQSTEPDTYVPASTVKMSDEYRPKNTSVVSIIRALP